MADVKHRAVLMVTFLYLAVTNVIWVSIGLDVFLVFVLTHTPGRSKRFSSQGELQQFLRRIAPEAGTETTFQFEKPGNLVSDSAMEARVVTLLQAAKKLIDDDNERVALGLIFEALNHDCGSQPEDYAATRDLVRSYVPLLLRGGRYPATLSDVAAIFYAWGDQDLGVRLLKKYARTAITLPRATRLWLTLRLYVRLRTRCRIAFERLVGGRRPSEASTKWVGSSRRNF